MSNTHIYITTTVIGLNFVHTLFLNLMLWVSKSKHVNISFVGETRYSDTPSVLRILAPLAPELIISPSGDEADKKKWIMWWRVRMVSAMLNLMLTPALIHVATRVYIDGINVGETPGLREFSICLYTIMSLGAICVVIMASLNGIFSWPAIRKGLARARRPVT